MSIKWTMLLVSLICGQVLQGQKKWPVIRANSKLVDIRDGDDFTKGRWTITPQARPDVFTTSVKKERVVFYTDVDSIAFKVEPGAVYDFIILLNGKDSAWTQIRYVPGKLDILKLAGKYNTGDQRQFPAFTYQSMADPDLVALRKGLNLDSIAGQGLEISKILNLLRWIHNLIPHDGNHDNPIVKNALSMVAECKKENRGLNCRGLSTVLNECYLSLGIRSRFITCMPKDSIFDDCHVINLVYSNDYKKWIWIDPTNNAYVMNENGVLLDPAEVRERLIDGRPLILNPDANWNNRSSVTKEEYLYHYMAKNLYRIQCPLDSKYDYETWKNGKTVSYIELLPLDAYKQAPQKSTETNTKTGTTFINYKTNNPDLFWTTPK